MYESFYGLTSKPFQLNPDPAFYYGSKQHQRAKAYLDYGVMRNEGFIVITGEVGAGKTTILGGLLNSLSSDVVAGQLVTTQLDAEDTLRMVGAAFGFHVKNVPKSEVLITLEAFLISQASQGRRCLLVVDEAQNLTPRAVEELRMLSNYQLGTQSLLQSFLVGQPEFREILQRPEMKQFRQRVAATCHLGPLDLEDTRGYIVHRLKCAGSTGKPDFEEAAFAAIFEASGGIPRRINSVCDRLLLLGFLQNKTRLGVDDVAQVVRDFADDSPTPVRSAASSGASSASAMNGSALDVDLSRLQLDEPAANGIAADLDDLIGDQQRDRLQRLEHSLQRLERVNQQTLTLLQKLVDAVKKPDAGGAP